MARARNWCFTLNNPDDGLLDTDTPFLPAPLPSVTYAVWQLELAPATGTQHLQGYAEFDAPLRLAAVKRWLPTAHWEPRRGTRVQARDYCRKAESRVDGPWEYREWTEAGQGRRTDLEDAAECLQLHGIKRVAELHPTSFIKFHRGLRALATELEQLPSDPGFIPRPWQQSVLDRLLLPPDDRTILWVCDTVGGKGKSRLVRHLLLQHKAILLEGRLADMCYSYNKEPIVCFDISRAAAEHSDHLYSMAEKLKNGVYLSTKYESAMKVFTPPHVIFFANMMYDQDKWSRDRVVLTNL